MEKDYTKIVWKIEELWKKYYKPIVIPGLIRNLDILHNYQDNISRYYSNFKIVDEFDFLESEKNVHSDDYGEYKGLKNSQLLFKNNIPVYLFDNHNKIVYPFVELYESSRKSLTIVHIDAHPDDAQFQGEKFADINLENIQNFIAQTRISDFFDAMQGMSLRGTKQSQNTHENCHNLESKKIIGEIYRVCHSDSFEFFLPPEKPYILSLDIDIFGPEGDFCELEDKVRTIALAWNKADAVCIAMSPGFIDQRFAREIVKVFVE